MKTLNVFINVSMIIDDNLYFSSIDTDNNDFV